MTDRATHPGVPSVSRSAAGRVRGRPWTRLPGLQFGRLLPRACLLCEAACGADPLCAPCATFLPGAHRPRCSRCARPWQTSERCASCRDSPPPADLTIAAADYVPPLDRAITSLKFAGRTALAGGLGRLVGQAWFRAVQAGRVGTIDALVPVPLARARLAERGFNQAHLIAAAARAAFACAARAAPPGLQAALPAVPALEPALLARLRDTRAQSQLPSAARQANLDHGFVASGRVDGRVIGVVDDVMTTGATLYAVAVALKTAGAAGVVNLVVARTP